MYGHMSIKAERVSVDLGGFRTCGDRRGQVSEIGWQYPPAQKKNLKNKIRHSANFIVRGDNSTLTTTYLFR